MKRVRVLVDIDEGCYKCPQRGDVGEVVDTRMPTPDGSPTIGVRLAGRVTYFFDAEVEEIL